MNNFVLRKLIRFILESNDSKDKDDGPDDLLIEPDLPPNEDEEQNEMSVVGAVGGTAPSGAMRGATSPLGDKSVQTKSKKKKIPQDGKDTVGTRSFGGGSKL
jgi:hypothetical protein